MNLPGTNSTIQYQDFILFFKGASDMEANQKSFTTPNVAPINEDHLLIKAQAVTREAARSEHNISFYFER